MTNLKGVTQALQQLGVDMPGNHQIAPRRIKYLKPTCRWAYQADADKGDPGLRARDTGKGVFSLTQCLYMRADQTGQPSPKK
ncbi:Uncharacterised protein [Klebsiella variicola]|nr:Uncharacterised protein [Klebsiella variicola]